MSKSGVKVATTAATGSTNSTTKKRKSISTGNTNTDDDDDDHDDVFLPEHIPVRIRNDNDISLKRPIICSFPGGLPASMTESTDTDNAYDDDQFPTFQLIKTLHTQPVLALQVQQQQQQQKQSRKSLTTTGTASTTKSYIEHNLVGKDDSCYYSAHVTLPVVSTDNDDNDNSNDTIDIDKTKIGYAKNQRSVMCVGVYDTNTNQLVIHPTYANGNVFTFDQSVPTYKNNINDNDDDDNNNERMKNPSTNAERYNALFADFGSKKKNKIIQSQRANQVRVANDNLAVNNSGSTTDNNNNNINGVQSIVSDEFLQSMVDSSGGNDPLSTRTMYMKEQRAISMAGGGGNATNANANANAANTKLDVWRQQFLPPYDNEEKQSFRIYKLYPYVISKNSYDYMNIIFTSCCTKAREQNVHPIDILLLNSRTTLERIPPPPIVIKNETNDNNTTTNNDDKQQQSKQEIGEYYHESIRCILKNIKRKNPLLHSFEQQQEDYDDIADDNEDTILTTTITPRQQVLFCIILNQYMILVNTIQLLLKKHKSGTIYGPKSNKNYYNNAHIRIAKQFIQLFLHSDNTSTNTIYEQQYTFPKIKLDKCYTHLLLVYLLCDGGIMMKSETIHNFITDINLDTNNAIIFLRQAGCKVLKVPIKKGSSTNSSSSKVSASLPKGPIIFPTNRSNGKKK